MKRFFRNLAAYYAGIEKRFYKGPSFLYIPPRKMVMRKGKMVPGYISPTLMLLYWGYGILQLFFPAQGWLFLWSYLAIGFYSTVMTRSPALFLFLALTVAGGLNIFYRFLFAPHLRVKRFLPSLASVNTPFSVSYELENGSLLPAYDVTLEPFLRMPFLEMESRKRYTLKRGEKRHLEIRFLLKKRGIYTFPRPGAETGFPFGLFRKSFLGDKNEPLQTIAVAPRASLQRWHIFSGDPGERRGGIRQDNRKKNSRKKRQSASMEFAGLREYHPGDEIRHIHFPSSARKGELVMKEFQEEEKPHFLVILDPFMRVGNPFQDAVSFFLTFLRTREFLLPKSERKALFEESIAAAYGCIASIREQLDGTIDFLYIGGDDIKLLRDAGEGKNYSYLLPLTLAGVEECFSKSRWQEFSSVIQEEESSCAIYISPFISEEGREILAKLRKGSWNIIQCILEEEERKDG